MISLRVYQYPLSLSLLAGEIEVAYTEDTHRKTEIFAI